MLDKASKHGNLQNKTNINCMARHQKERVEAFIVVVNKMG